MSRLEELIQELCPNGVEWQNLESVCKQIFAGGTPNTAISEYYDGDIPWIRSGEINFNIIKKSERCITELGYRNSSAKLIEAQSVVMAMTGATVAKSAIVDIELTANQSVCALVPLRKVLNYKFLYYCLSNMYNDLKSKGQGALTSLNLKMIKEVRIPVPPMEVQCEIVHILDQFTLLTAELTAELTGRQQQYEYYRNKLIDEVVGKKGKLIELLIQPVTDGPHTTPKLYKEGVPFVSATAIYDGKVHLNDMKGYISKEFDEECSRKYKPKKFDVYMVKSGSTTGKVAIVDFDADFNIWSPLAALRTGSETQAWYLYHLLQTSNVQEQVLSRMSQGSQPNLSMRVIEQFDVIIPSMDEQERIVNIINKFDAYCNDLTQGLPAEIELRKQQYEYYRDKLLSFKELEV